MHQNVFENRNNPIERTEEEIQLGFNFTKTSSRTFTRSLSRKQDFPIKRGWIVGSFACVGSKCRSEIGRRILSGEIASFIHPFICHARFPVSLISNIRFQRWWWGEGNRVDPSPPRPVIKYLFIRPSLVAHVRDVPRGSCHQLIATSTTRWLQKGEKKKKQDEKKNIEFSFYITLRWNCKDRGLYTIIDKL